MKRLRVYLSSTFEDLKEYRAAVFNALERAGLDVARMEAYAATDERPLDLCLRDVAQSDIYVGLYAWRYGYEPPAAHGNTQSKSITELEYRQAASCKLRKLLFFADPDTKAQWPDRFKDDATGAGECGAKLKALRSELSTEKTASFFNTPDELATLVLAAIMRSGLSGRPYNVPPRPTGFVSRGDLTQALIDSLIGVGAGGAGRGHTLVHGVGGFGKTTLAIDACHQPEVVSSFPDGMLWIVLGEQSNLATKLSDLHVSATGSPPVVAGVDALSEALAKALEGRRCLLVVDDVWRAEDLTPFLRIDGSRLLVTTRIRDLVEQIGQTDWQEVPVEEMGADEAVALLGRGLALDDPTRATLGDLAGHLGCWPLLLDLANARLLEERKTRREDLADSLHRVATLFKSRGVLGFDRRDSRARNAAVARSLAVGLEFADAMVPGLAERAAEMSVFPEDVPIPMRVLGDLWKLAELDVEEEVARPLANLSLLRWNRDADAVQLHDMIRRALQERLVGPAMVHRKLIDAWGDPYRLPHDYAWRWFGWHCMGARDEPRLHKLLLDFDWLRAKLAATDTNALLSDFDHIGSDPLADLLQRACRLSTYVLARDKSQLAGQLLARIPEQQKLLRDRILERALAAGEPWLRPLTASLAAERSSRWLRPATGEALRYVAFSSNGLWAAYASGEFGEPQDVILWNLKDWQAQGPRFRTFARRNPFALALSDDGQWCLYADSIGRVHRLSASGVPAWEGNVHRDLTIGYLLAISADGRRALSACQHGRLVAWDIDAGRHEIVWDESDNIVTALTLDEAGDSAVAARVDGSINLLDLWSARQRTLFKLNGRPNALARSRDKSIVAAGTVDGRIEVHRVHSPEEPIGIFETPEQPTSMVLSSCRRYLAVGTAKGTVEVWNIARGVRSARYSRAHTDAVKCIGFSQQDDRVVSADSLHIKEWSLEAAEEEQTVCAAGMVRVTADGLRALAALEDGRLGVWNIRTGAPESALPRPSGPAFGDHGIGPPEGMALATKAARVLLWNAKLLCVWDLEVGISVGSLSVADTRDAAISPDGAGVVYVNGYDVTLWRPDDARSSVLGTYDGDPPGYVAVSPDGQRALSSGGAREVVVWCLNEDDPLVTEFEQVRRRKRELGIPVPSWAKIATCWVNSRDKPAMVVCAGPSDAIVTAGDGSLFVFDISKPGITEAPRRFASAHGARVSRLLVTSDGTRAVTSSLDRTIRVWNLGTRQCIAVLNAHPGTMEKISTGGERALLFSHDGMLKIISLHDGALFAAFQGDKQIHTCDADAGLQWVVACDQGGQMHFLHVEHEV
jgi:WD40 repeat protein